MNLHLAIEGVLDDAKAAIRALITSEADPVVSTSHDAPPAEPEPAVPEPAPEPAPAAEAPAPEPAPAPEATA